MKSVSVVIPFYNSSQTLERALSSVMSQSFSRYEVLLVDDGSSPEQAVQLKEILKKFNSVKLIRMEKNCGAAVARNMGVSHASGEWIAFLDSDDVWLPSKLKTCAKYSSQYDFISHEYTEYSASIRNEDSVNMKLKYSDFLLKNRISTPSVMIRKCNFMPFDEQLRYSEDYAAWLNYFYMGVRAIHLCSKLAHGSKRAYGEKGLSSHIFSMYNSEVYILYNQFRLKRINLRQVLIIQIFWFSKFVRRFFLIAIRRIIYA
jgi:teichuronic acid biosynthesis glycosyltransferase TuaG